MDILKQLWSILIGTFNKLQLIAMAVIAFIVLFLSEHNVFALMEYDEEINELNDQIEYYKEQITTDSLKLEELDADKEQIEKFGRENYFMKKANEDVFIFE